MKATTFAPAAAAAVLGLLAAAPAVQASTVGSAAADGTVFVVDITSSFGGFDGLEFNGTDFVDTFENGDGNFTVDADGNVFFFADPLGIGAGSDMGVNAFADGTSSPTGFFEAEALTFGFLTIENNSSTNGYTIDLGFDYVLDAIASVGGALEDAFAFANIELLVDGSVLAFSAITADALLGPPSDGDSGTHFFQLHLDPGESADITVTANAFAFGVSPVPVPAALPLLATGLIGLLGVARRRRLAA